MIDDDGGSTPNHDGLKYEQARAVRKDIANAYVQVTLTLTKLAFTIDYRKVVAWRKELTKWGVSYTMVDTRTGEVLSND